MKDQYHLFIVTDGVRKMSFDLDAIVLMHIEPVVDKDTGQIIEGQLKVTMLFSGGGGSGNGTASVTVGTEAADALQEAWIGRAPLQTSPSIQFPSDLQMPEAMTQAEAAAGQRQPLGGGLQGYGSLGAVNNIVPNE